MLVINGVDVTKPLVDLVFISPEDEKPVEREEGDDGTVLTETPKETSLPRYDVFLVC